MATKQENQETASQSGICRLEWVTRAMLAARQHQEAAPQKGPVEYALEGLNPEDLEEVGA